MMGEIVTRNM